MAGREEHDASLRIKQAMVLGTKRNRRPPDLGGEVADDVGLVAAPERGGALLAEDAGEGVGDALVGPRQGAPP